MRIGFMIDNAEDPRIEEAFGSVLGKPPGEPATQREIEEACYNWVEQTTHDYERRKDMSEFVPPPFGGVTYD